MLWVNTEGKDHSLGGYRRFLLGRPYVRICRWEVGKAVEWMGSSVGGGVSGPGNSICKGLEVTRSKASA